MGDGWKLDDPHRANKLGTVSPALPRPTSPTLCRSFRPPCDTARCDERCPAWDWSSRLAQTSRSVIACQLRTSLQSSHYGA